MLGLLARPRSPGHLHRAVTVQGHGAQRKNLIPSWKNRGGLPEKRDLQAEITHSQLGQRMAALGQGISSAGSMPINPGVPEAVKDVNCFLHSLLGRPRPSQIVQIHYNLVSPSPALGGLDGWRAGRREAQEGGGRRESRGRRGEQGEAGPSPGVGVCMGGVTGGALVLVGGEQAQPSLAGNGASGCATSERLVQGLTGPQLAGEPAGPGH